MEVSVVAKGPRYSRGESRDKNKKINIRLLRHLTNRR